MENQSSKVLIKGSIYNFNKMPRKHHIVGKYKN